MINWVKVISGLGVTHILILGSDKTSYDVKKNIHPPLITSFL